MNKPDITIIDKKFKVIYIRFKGSYTQFRKESMSMFKELFNYATKHNLVNEDITKVLTIYHDNPFITNEKNLKTSVAMTIPSNVDIIEEGRICTMEFEGKYAILHYELALNEYGKAWEYTYNEWLFKNKEVKPRDNFPFELYVNEPPRNYKDKSLVDIYIPIE